MGGKFTIADALYGLGRVAQVRSDYGLAHSLYKEALALRRDVPERWVVAYTLDALATIAIARGQAHRAARLFGVTESLYELIRFMQAPYERDVRERAVAATRSQLDEATFAKEWGEGRAMTLDQAVEYALAE